MGWAKGAVEGESLLLEMGQWTGGVREQEGRLWGRGRGRRWLPGGRVPGMSTGKMGLPWRDGGICAALDMAGGCGGCKMLVRLVGRPNLAVWRQTLSARRVCKHTHTHTLVVLTYTHTSSILLRAQPHVRGARLMYPQTTDDKRGCLWGTGTIT